MQVVTNDKMYVVKFYYGKAKNPNHRGIWRNRTSKCVISEMVTPSVVSTDSKGKRTISVPAVLKEVCSGVTKNCHGEAFIKSVGRRMAFMKALASFPNQELRRKFIEEFDLQCSTSANNAVRMYTTGLLNSLPE